jgi:hypothetical protein
VRKDDEHVLERLLAANRVDERLLDLYTSQRGGSSVLRTRVVHVKVASEDSPKDALERGHSGALDGSGDELEVETGQTGLAGKRAVLCGMFEQGGRAVAVVKRSADLSVTVLGLKRSV